MNIEWRESYLEIDIFPIDYSMGDAYFELKMHLIKNPLFISSISFIVCSFYSENGQMCSPS